MLARNHVPFSIGLWSLACPAMGVPLLSAALVVPLVAFAALVPDIDHPSSTLGRRLPGISHLIRAVLGHRGGTHSLLAVLIWSVVIGIYGQRVVSGDAAIYHVAVLAMGFGYLTHILADGLTKSGVPLLWPYKRDFRSPIAFTTGSIVEYVVVWLLVGYAAMELAKSIGVA